MSKKEFKRTKIVATVGPAVFAEEKLKEMVYAGVNMFRLNFSHGAPSERDEQIAIIRKYAAERGKSVAILQDLQGPKIRFGEIKDNYLELKTGDELVIDYACQEHDGGLTVPCQYNLAEKMKVGEKIFLYDGHVRGTISEIVSDTAVKMIVENDGCIMSRKGINLPDTDMGGDIFTPKDLADIEFGVSRDFDYVAASFIQKGEDMEKLRSILVSQGSNARIIAKVETKAAVWDDETMEGVVKASDGIMIARGDLAYEAGEEIIPVVERKLNALCRKYGKIVIVATQMLLSMTESPQPTRAEVNDVATAVILGADATMLSEESAMGKYPIEAIKEMKKIILYTQNNMKVKELDGYEAGIGNENYDAIAKAAVKIAEEIDADVIVSTSHTGATTRAISAQRPSLPIISITDDARVAGQCALCYGTASFLREFERDHAFDAVQDLKNKGYLQVREGRDSLTVVVVSGLRNEEGATNQIQIRNI